MAVGTDGGPEPRTLRSRKVVDMTDTPDAELGPIDYVVVEFPAGQQRFTGAMAAELASLADAGMIQILDLLVLLKDADGSIEALEVEDLGDLACAPDPLALFLVLPDDPELRLALEALPDHGLVARLEDVQRDELVGERDDPQWEQREVPDEPIRHHDRV